MDALHYHDTATGQIYLHPREVQAEFIRAGVPSKLAQEIVGECLRRAYDAHDREVADERA